MSVTPAATKTRVSWVDILKGVAIILVVGQHCIDFLESVGWEWGPLTLVFAAIGTVRMPAFFFAAALFFGANLTRPWSFVLARRVAPMLYLFALWSLIRAAYLTVGPWPLDPDIDPGAFALTIFVDPRSSMWFVYALAFYFTAVRATSALPHRIGWVLAVLFSAPFLLGSVTTGNWGWDNIFKMYVFFYAGVHLKAWLMQVSDRLSWWMVATPAAVWAVLLGLSYVLFRALATPLLPFIIVAGLCAVVIASILVARRFQLRWLQAVGLQTLPVYLLHVYPLAIGATLLGALAPSPYAVPVAFVMLTALAVAVSYGVWLPLRHVPGLFSAPWSR